MKGSIRLLVSRDGDGSGRLTLEFRSGSYSGAGSAHFDFEVLSREARKFDAYPLPPESAMITGGFLDEGNISKVREEHVHISAYPLGPLGRLGLLVKVAEPANDDRRGALKRSASAEFVTEYEQLSLLARGLTELANGLRVEFILEFVE